MRKARISGVRTHLICGIAKVTSDNWKDVNKSIASIMFAGKYLGSRVSYAFALCGTHVIALDSCNTKYMCQGSFRSRARNNAFDYIDIEGDERSIVHFIDCDQLVPINLFAHIETLFTKNSFIGTLRNNFKTNGNIQLDERLKNKNKCQPSWKTMYSNCISIPFKVAQKVKWDERFEQWGHEDIMFALDCLSEFPKINFKYNNTAICTHLDHPIGIQNNTTLKLIADKYPWTKDCLVEKYEDLQHIERPGF